jgi:hypothetical protein
MYEMLLVLERTSVWALSLSISPRALSRLCASVSLSEVTLCLYLTWFFSNAYCPLGVGGGGGLPEQPHQGLARG